MKKRTESELSRREYRSELRAEQARATRERILDAALELLRSGAREMSYASLAKTARVSVPTIYRHFPTRPELFEAIYVRTEATGVSTQEVEQDFHGSLRKFFARFDDPEGVHARATRLNAVWEFSRATTVPRRKAWCEATISRQLPGLPEPQRTLLLDLCVVLLSSAMVEAHRGYLDRSGVETAERVQFALDALFAHAATFLPVETG